MSQFEINPEFNANGNLHYHGYFIIKDKVKWFKNVLPKMKYNGLVKINIVKDNLQSAMEYCRKDNIIMKQVIKKYPVPYTHLCSLTLLTKPDIIQDNIMTYLDNLNRVKESRRLKAAKIFIATDTHDLDQDIVPPNVSH